MPLMRHQRLTSKKWKLGFKKLVAFKATYFSLNQENPGFLSKR
jgi:hypothetical protein